MKKLLILLLALFLCGCSMSPKERVKVKDLEMTVVSEELVSDALKTILEEKKENPFQVTYTDEENLYICIGYGKQNTGGYSIAVDELYQTADAIYVSTTLLGPGEKEKENRTPSYPVIVIKTEKLSLPVVVE